MKNNSPIFWYIAAEKQRQKNNIELIASENYVSEEILQAQGSILTNKYAEGYPWKRYYEGCTNVDNVESYAKEQLKGLFNTFYSVNVQPHSWSNANLSVYLAVMKLRKKKISVLWMSLDAGGHLTHWAMPSFSGSRYGIVDSATYGIDSEGYIDMMEVRKQALTHKPDLIIAGASAYSRTIDFKAFKEIADLVWAYLLTDIAHIAGLVATDLHPSPFGIADFVTSTTHKTLRGPRWGIILSKDETLAKAVDSAVFPWTQGWPLMHIIAAKGVCFEQARMPSFTKYMEGVKDNAKTMEKEIKKIEIDWKKINIVSGGTDNHLLLLDFRELGLSGKDVEGALEEVGITTNKNSVPWDENPARPSGLRIGSAAITSRGCNKEDIILIIGFIEKVIDSLYYKKGKPEGVQEEVIKLMSDKSLYPEV